MSSYVASVRVMASRCPAITNHHQFVCGDLYIQFQHSKEIPFLWIYRGVLPWAFSGSRLSPTIYLSYNLQSLNQQSYYLVTRHMGGFTAQGGKIFTSVLSTVLVQASWSLHLTSSLAHTSSRSQSTGNPTCLHVQALKIKKQFLSSAMRDEPLAVVSECSSCTWNARDPGCNMDLAQFPKLKGSMSKICKVIITVWTVIFNRNYEN